MAEQLLSPQKLWLGGYDLSTRLNALAIENAAEAVDVTAFGDVSRAFAGGLKSVSASHAGFWDAAGGVDAELFDRLTLADAPMSLAVTDGAEGDTAFTFRALHAEYSPGASIGEAFTFSIAAQSGAGDGLVRGTLMHNGAETATVNGAGRQLGAVAAGQKLFGALHVTAASGTAPTLDITVESDDNAGFTTAVTRMTFSQQTGIGFEWPAPVAGPITDDWWRLVITIGGTTPSFEFAAILAIQ
jgi:hypothetical protein